VNEDIKDRLHAIVAASVSLRYLLEIDGDDWRLLPIDIQNAINSAAIVCDKLPESIMEAVGP
jgi:hypothetical protein